MDAVGASLSFAVASLVSGRFDGPLVGSSRTRSSLPLAALLPRLRSAPPPFATSPRIALGRSIARRERCTVARTAPSPLARSEARAARDRPAPRGPLRRRSFGPRASDRGNGSSPWVHRRRVGGSRNEGSDARTRGKEEDRGTQRDLGRSARRTARLVPFRPRGLLRGPSTRLASSFATSFRVRTGRGRSELARLPSEVAARRGVASADAIGFGSSIASKGGKNSPEEGPPGHVPRDRDLRPRDRDLRAEESRSAGRGNGGQPVRRRTDHGADDAGSVPRGRMLASRMRASASRGPRTRSNKAGRKDASPRAASVDIASPENALIARGEARLPVLMAFPGGEVEQILAFPIIEAVKKRYPNSDVDVLVPSRGKSAYELNPNVRNVFVQELDGYSRPDETTALTGKLRNNGYQKLISAKPAGASFSLQMLATVIPERISYISREGYVFNWIASLVMKGERVPTMRMATYGASMYDLLWKIALEEEAPKAKNLNFTIPQKATTHAKEILAGIKMTPQRYVLVQTSPEPDMDASSEPLDWTKFGSDLKMPVLFVTKTKEEAKASPNNKAVAVPSTAELAALIEMSAGVVCGNTAALQLGTALGKPVVLVSKSDDIADAFVPGHVVPSVHSPEAAESIASSWQS